MHTEDTRTIAAGNQPRSKEPTRKALFLRADQVSEILGIAASTIRNQAAQGTFPIPHRRVGKAILFKAAAVAEWCSADTQPAIAESASVARPCPLPAIKQAARPEPLGAAPPAPRMIETDKQRCARVKAEALAIMEARRGGARIAGA